MSTFYVNSFPSKVDISYGQLETAELIREYKATAESNYKWSRNEYMF